MSSINQSVSKVGVKLLNPKSQAPTLEQRFDAVLTEFQNFTNELENTNLPWSHEIEDVIILQGTTDYLMTHQGKPLFVVAYPQNSNLAPYMIDFATLGAATTDFWLFSPLDAGLFRDFGEAWSSNWPFQVAFFWQNGAQYMRVSPYVATPLTIRVTFSVGNWIENVNVESSAVMRNHHGLVETRASQNLLAGCEWTTPESDEIKRRNLERNFERQEAKQAENFMYSKRSLTADGPSVRMEYGDGY